ncbi:MAG: hypothetical protein WD069_20230 [Planctomycetales bacterium]
MPDHACDAVLNRVLVDLGRSLLQYVGECWPWTPESEEDVRRALDGLVERQREQAARLVELLSRREWPIDFGAYPTAYTDLHYIALDHLLKLLGESESRLLEEVERSAAECAGDAAAAATLAGVAAAQREIVEELRGLCRGEAALRSL